MTIIDYSQTGFPSELPDGIKEQVRTGEAMIMYPLNLDSCVICSNILTLRLHEFHSYKVCGQCSPSA